MTEGDLFARLYRHYYPQGAATVRHVSVGEAYRWASEGKPERAQHGIRRIDALVIRRNVQKGDSLLAVEIKITASDLRRELADPVKPDTWAQYVEQFYYLVPPELLDIALAEIPKPFGVMVAGDYGVTIRRRATRNTAPKPLPLDTWRRLASALGLRQYDDILDTQRRAREQRTTRPNPAP